jgi:hypothetical protein
MTNITWRELAEAIGIVSIVASLVFVGLQLRQSQQVAVAEQYQVRAISAVERLSSITQNDRYIQIASNSYREAYEADALDASRKNAYEQYGPDGLIVLEI